MTDLARDLVAALGLAVFERQTRDCFRLFEPPPAWLAAFPPAAPSPAEAFPFLEEFLSEAEPFWATDSELPPLISDLWTQPDSAGEPRRLRATAVRTAGANLLLLASADRLFNETQAHTQHAHETSLANARIAKLSRELERATNAKSEFLARMSHEIRTPMNAILGMSDLLWETPLNVEQREYVRIFRRAGDNLLNVINDVLDLSKIESGHIELEHIDFDLREILDKAAEIAAVRAHAKGLELSFRIAPGLPGHFNGDPGRLRQVILNLLGNAVKFTDAGEVFLQVEQNPDDAPPGSLRFSVSDTGAGIPPDRVATIFESFAQAGASTSRTHGGTGLGLAISRRFIELMGGRIWVESTGAAGTTFSFTARFGVPDVAVSSPSDHLTGETCLVVSGNDHHRGAVSDLLREWGARVIEAGSVDHALKQLALIENNDILALIDAQIDVAEDGFELAVRILESAARKNPVVVMLTTNRVAETARYREAGLSTVLKPVRAPELLEALQAGPSRRPQEPARSQFKRSARILLADDSEDNRFLVRAYLRDSGCTLDEAENGADAVEKFRRTHYDLVLTDIEMPVLDGYSATRQMRAWEREHGTPETPILALTAHALAQESRQSVDAGCTAHLTKPIRKQPLLDALEHFLPLAPVATAIHISVEPWLRDAVPGYLEKRRLDVRTLRDALVLGKRDSIRMIGHQLTGTGAAYGFDAITEIGESLESAALAEDMAAVRVQIESLDSYLAHVIVEYKR